MCPNLGEISFIRVFVHYAIFYLQQSMAAFAEHSLGKEKGGKQV